MVHFIASDAHGSQRRPPGLARALDVARTVLGSAVEAEALVLHNPQHVIDGRVLDIEPPRDFKRGWLSQLRSGSRSIASVHARRRRRPGLKNRDNWLLWPYEKASIVDAKNNLSRYLEYVGAGHRAHLQQSDRRSRPGAGRRDILRRAPSTAQQERMHRLERQGIVRRGTGEIPKRLPKATKGQRWGFLTRCSRSGRTGSEVLGLLAVVPLVVSETVSVECERELRSDRP